MFRFKKSVPVEYDRQGYIYFVSRLHKELPADKQQQILNLCVEAGGEYCQALYEFVTSDVGATAVCRKHFLSQSTLERIVRKYYILFAEKL
jgi:hypothetical protein